MFSYNGDGITQETLDKINQAGNYNHYLPPVPLGPINMTPFLHIHDQNFTYATQSMLKEPYRVSSNAPKMITDVPYHHLYRPPSNDLTLKSNNGQSMDLRFDFGTNAINTSIKDDVQSYQLKFSNCNNLGSNLHKKEVLKNDDITQDHNFDSKVKLVAESISTTEEIPERKTVNKQQNINKTEHKIIETDKHLNESKLTEEDFKNPYVRDANGVKQRDVKQSQNIVEGNEASQAALLAIKGEDSKRVYKCDDCLLHFLHPKRFLVHTRWHLFGQNHERRRQIIEEKEQKKLAKKKVPEKLSEDQGLKCDVCSTIWGSPRKLQAHRMKAHADVPRPCLICGETFTTAAQADEHMKTHQGDGETARFACDECPKTFKIIYSLLRHSEVHREKKFPCDQCSRLFTSMSRLRTHKRNHEKYLRGTTHHCSYCGKGFYEAYALSAHERTHRNERPYKCDICHSSYGTNSTLKKHILRSHSSDLPFSCSTCHRCFTTDKTLRRHIAAAHTEGSRRSKKKKKSSQLAIDAQV